MAKITLDNIRHSYLADPRGEQDFALKNIDAVWNDGGAYALLGPSGCGKTTLLNIISGLLTPSEGSVLFDDIDVTNTPTGERHIAQVFQFPVVYDTMTVYDNLAFPLRNRGVPEDRIRARVHEIAEMLDLEGMLRRRAAKLTADGKQKISLGRGLVRAAFGRPLGRARPLPRSSYGATAEAVSGADARAGPTSRWTPGPRYIPRMPKPTDAGMDRRSSRPSGRTR